MTISREELIAHLDGELGSEAAARVESAIAEDANLRAEMKRQKLLSSRVRAAFSSVLEEEIPARLLDAVRKSPLSWRMRLTESGRLPRTSPFAWRLVLASALSAALVLGLFIGVGIERFSREGEIFMQGERGPFAQSQLAAALENQLSSEQRGEEKVSIGLTYRDLAGRYCRSFTTGTVLGLACRNSGVWQIGVLTEEGARSRYTYDQAASTMPQVVREAIRASIAGAPFDAAQERRARDTGWSR